MAASDITMPDGKYLADIVANLNVVASDPATSRGAGEIIYQSTAGILKVNTGTAGSPVWTAVGAGGAGDFKADGSVPMTGDLTIDKASPAVILDTSATSSLLKFLQSSVAKAQIWTSNAYLIIKSFAGDLQIIASESAGSKVEIGTNDTIRLSVADDAITTTVPLAMGGNAITNAAIAGTNSALFIINQNNAGVEASAIEFDRGSVATAARILWSEANDWFSFEDVTGSTKATIDAAKLQVTDAVNLDGQTGTVKISENDSTGDMEFQVAAGDSFVFKTV